MIVKGSTSKRKDSAKGRVHAGGSINVYKAAMKVMKKSYSNKNFSNPQQVFRPNYNKTYNK